MTSSRNPYERLRRSFETQRLEDVLPAAAEVGWINLSDALSILALMAREGTHASTGPPPAESGAS